MSVVDAKAPRGNVLASFKVAEHEFAVDVRHVQEVVRRPPNILQMPLQPGYVLGVFNLRGQVVPLLRTGHLLGLDVEPNHPDIRVAIVVYRGVRLGLMCDDTSRILRPPAKDLVPLTYAESSGHNVASAVLRLPDGLISVLDLDRLLALADVPHAQNGAEVDDLLLRAKRQRKRCISFQVGTSRMAFPIGEIHEILPATLLERSPMQDKLTAGLIRVRKRIVPVLRFAVLLQPNLPINPAAPDAQARVIVLNLGPHRIGLLVDSVDAIETYTVDQCLSVPVLSRHRPDFYSGCIDFGERGQVLLLQASGVLREDEIAQVTGQHSALFEEPGAQETRARRSAGRSAYLWFRAGLGFAMPMREIREILDLRHRMLAMPGAPEFVQGMINLRGQMVPVVDLRAFYRLTAAPTAEGDNQQKILVIDHADGLVGLCVDAVHSIVNVTEQDRLAVPSLMRSTLPASLRQDMREVVQARSSDGESADLLTLDVSRVIAAMCAQADTAGEAA